MAAAADQQPCRFLWHIWNPFVPWRRMIATFYLGSTIRTEWKVTLEPESQCTDMWNFRFSLRGTKPGFPADDIVTNRLEVQTSINGEPMNQREVENYIFQSSNWHTYGFTAYAHTGPQRHRPHYLLVEIAITLPSRDIAIQTGENPAALIKLSGDLERLFNLPSYFNLTLNSTHAVNSFYVHSYILNARWTNFRTVHHTITGNTVDMNISDVVLWEILRYMYSGKLDFGGPDWRDTAFVTEVFKVIERYKIHHLYKVFATDETRQHRLTSQSLIIRVGEFRLDNNGKAIPVLRYRWKFNVDGANAENANGDIVNVDVNPNDVNLDDDPMEDNPDGDPMEDNPEGNPMEDNPEGNPMEDNPEGNPMEDNPEGNPMEDNPEGNPMEDNPEGNPMEDNPDDNSDDDDDVNDEQFVFKIHFMLLPNNSFFQYILKSKCPRRMHVQVNLAFKIRKKSGDLNVRSVHQRDFTIRPNGTVNSGSCRFEGQTDELTAFIQGRSKMQFYIRCTLYLSDGTSIIQVHNENRELLGDLARYKVLSDHMYELIDDPIDTDFTLCCLEEVPVNPEDPYVPFKLHKSIFEARVPAWRAVLGNIVEGDNYPNTVILDTMSDVFEPVRVYIYTGKISYIADRHFDAVDEFAERAGLTILRNLVNQLRLYSQNPQLQIMAA